MNLTRNIPGTETIGGKMNLTLEAMDEGSN
jgi:hypothetical protein